MCDPPCPGLPTGVPATVVTSAREPRRSGCGTVTTVCSNHAPRLASGPPRGEYLGSTGIGFRAGPESGPEIGLGFACMDAFNRWSGLAGGALLGAVDTATLWLLGVRIEVNGGDATLPVGFFFGSSFALLGFLLGHVVEGRRRDRAAQAVIRAQTEDVACTRARLAQSEKRAALGLLATAIAHEVRNPLAVIRSAAQGLGETPVPDRAEAQRASAFITAEIDR